MVSSSHVQNYSRPLHAWHQEFATRDWLLLWFSAPRSMKLKCSMSFNNTDVTVKSLGRACTSVRGSPWARRLSVPTRTSIIQWITVGGVTISPAPLQRSWDSETFMTLIWLRSSSRSLPLRPVRRRWGHCHTKGSTYRWLMSKGLLLWVAFYSSMTDLAL